MTEWKLEKTEIFDKRFKKLIPKNLQKEVKKQILKLEKNPFVGKPLGYKFFRELKIKKWRIYFLIYQNKLVVYFIDLSDKKLQQETIDEIKGDFKFLKDFIDKKY